MTITIHYIFFQNDSSHELEALSALIFGNASASSPERQSTAPNTSIIDSYHASTLVPAAASASPEFAITQTSAVRTPLNQLSVISQATADRSGKKRRTD